MSQPEGKTKATTTQASVVPFFDEGSNTFSYIVADPETAASFAAR